MKFDRVIKSILKEDRDLRGVVVSGGKLSSTGSVINDEDYQDLIPGTVPMVMIQVLEDVEQTIKLINSEHQLANQSAQSL